jgi:hypothetical protein
MSEAEPLLPRRNNARGGKPQQRLSQRLSQFLGADDSVEGP